MVDVNVHDDVVSVHNPLAVLLSTLRVEAVQIGNLDLRAPWGGMVPPQPHMSVHLVVRGRAWLSTGTDSHQLVEGDLALVADGASHWLSSERTPGSVEPGGWPTGESSSLSTTLRIGGTGRASALVCMTMGVAGTAHHLVSQSLPPLIHLQRDDNGHYVACGTERRSDAVEGLTAAIRAEADADHASSGLVLGRLAEALLFVIMRSNSSLLPPSSAFVDAGDVGGGDLSDAALTAIFSQPEHPWTVATLARQAGMSRSAFAAAFRQRMGTSPIRYLRDWRMQVAAQRLLDEPGTTVAELARLVGYENESAFSQAFRAHHGKTVRAWASASGAAGPKP